MKKENEDERRRGGKKTEKNFDNAVMGARSEGGRVDDVCSGGVLLAGFRGVEISYNARDVCVDSFNPPSPRGGCREPLLVGPSICKTTTGELRDERSRTRCPRGSVYLDFIRLRSNQ